jgi:hypothetical protein
MNGSKLQSDLHWQLSIKAKKGVKQGMGVF